MHVVENSRRLHSTLDLCMLLKTQEDYTSVVAPGDILKNCETALRKRGTWDSVLEYF